VHLSTVHSLLSQGVDMSSLSPSLSGATTNTGNEPVSFDSITIPLSPSSGTSNLDNMADQSGAGGGSAVTSPTSTTLPRPFPCHLCPRIFSRKHDLQRHIRVHTGSKPYICLNCQKAFARTDALCRHYKVEEICRKAVVKLEADQGVRRLQQSQVQQTLQMEVREIQKAQKLRQQQQQESNVFT
jgi:hypothetical protein